MMPPPGQAYFTLPEAAERTHALGAWDAVTCPIQRSDEAHAIAARRASE